ncbi:MAG TPA: endo-1,4-beta-xylanase [Terriglobales bacterium]|nr:endo-1,4-beta-xylanase [Terriglobales bacterium]
MMRQLTFAMLLLGVIVSADAQTTLKSAFKDTFLVGAAMNRAQIFEEPGSGSAIIKEQFNSITPENILKWERVHPKPEEYDFAAADRFVEFGTKNKMFMVGHTLVWHNQTPKWVFEDEKGNPLTRDALLKRMRDHIHTVVGRYKGKINGWDVVNEALNEDGTLRQSKWMTIIGEDYIAQAFKFAHEADPKAELYYNDFSLENEAKRNGAIALLKKLKAQGVPVTAVGLQGHNDLEWPTVEQQDATIAAFRAIGLKVAITELDIDVLPRPPQQASGDAEVTRSMQATPQLNPYTNGLPDSVQQALAKRYADLFGIYYKYRGTVDRVTFWGVTDKESWKNNWPIRGRTNYPLLFDREGKPKAAFDSVIKTANRKSAHH